MLNIITHIISSMRNGSMYNMYNMYNIVLDEIFLPYTTIIRLINKSPMELIHLFGSTILQDSLALLSTYFSNLHG